MGNAIGKVFVDTIHGLCCWHMGQNAVKHLSAYKDEEPTEVVLPSDPGQTLDEEPIQGVLPCDPSQKKDEATKILKEYKRCMYLYEKEEKFEEVFKWMQSKVKKGSWLDGVYKLKHKWAYCYMKDVFTLGMRSTQLSESFNKDLKQHLKFNLDIVRFFKHFERAVQEKREKEIKSEHEARKKLPMLKLKGTPVLQQAANVYTPPIFKLFQEEFEKSTANYIKNSVQNDSIVEFSVATCSLEGKSTNDYGYKGVEVPIDILWMNENGNATGFTESLLGPSDNGLPPSRTHLTDTTSYTQETSIRYTQDEQFNCPPVSTIPTSQFAGYYNQFL
ncbi:hypothetical protein QYE76_005350 [Lolium multiflorum]|uniref:Protein FAR1-RELATED SEQUENCE n=1 Tax=Lolium multiflorum TaxID=4521 RepID=A0AAD8W0N3_LOLMU|nr:hypothetical protein QYE76_005350 [Lolium multiflorum]